MVTRLVAAMATAGVLRSVAEPLPSLEHMRIATLEEFMAMGPSDHMPQHWEVAGGESNRQAELHTFLNAVKERGYPVSTESVQTEDGVGLTMFRLPQPGKPPVLLQHGIMDSAWGFVFNTDYTPLAYTLFDAGYDVYLSNNRGVDFSTQWANGTDASYDRSFWKFSYDEMARYDLPANIAKVLEISGHEKLGLVAHSQGTTQTFIAGSSTDPAMREAVVSKVAFFVALSPIAQVGHTSSWLIQLLARSGVQLIARPLFPYTFLSGTTFRALEHFLCKVTLGVVCKLTVSMICGSSYLDPAANIAAYSTVFPFGTSLQDVFHYSQNLLNHDFNMYDYGEEGNMEKYDKPTPPVYNLTNFAIPSALLFAGKDALVAPPDAEWLLKQLGPTDMLKIVKTYRDFSHATWMLGGKAAGHWPHYVRLLLDEYYLAKIEKVIAVV